jgi:L-rhamnonate dehydratase
MQKATIKEVRAFIVKPGESGADYHHQGKGHWIVDTFIANPMSGYEKYKSNRTTWGINALGTVICEVELDNGIVGIGCSIGGEPACFIIEKHLSRFVEGQDPRDVELMWDQMWRATLPYGRKGLTIHAIGAVDLAIWDCLGKLRKEPVYALIGGKTKQKLPIYCTSSRPDMAKKLGFHGAKIPLPFGPADGDEGFKKNVETIKNARESIGPDFPLMIDCYMALTVPYAIKLIKAIEKYNITWIEEFLPPDDYEGYAEVKRVVGDKMLLTTGEHEYTRYGFRQLIEKKCVDILQPDVNWVGGLTEARRIVAMAAAYDIPVIPHGSSVFSYHLQIAYPNCPMGEFLNMSPKADTIVPVFGNLFKDEPLPQNGFIELSDKPGWGVELNREELNLFRPYDRSKSKM